MIPTISAASTPSRSPMTKVGSTRLDPCGLDHELGCEAEEQTEQDEPRDELLGRHPPVDIDELEDDIQDRAGRQREEQ